MKVHLMCFVALEYDHCREDVNELYAPLCNLKNGKRTTDYQKEDAKVTCGNCLRILRAEEGKK